MGRLPRLLAVLCAAIAVLAGCSVARPEPVTPPASRWPPAATWSTWAPTCFPAFKEIHGCL
jgi:hypothetical protein